MEVTTFLERSLIKKGGCRLPKIIFVVFMAKIEKEIDSIKERNKRVEADKAWETSVTRRIIIAVATYFIVAVFLFMIEAPNPLIIALVPAIGYVLSTLSLSFVKRYWIKNFYRGDRK